MAITHAIDGCLEEAIGSLGLSQDELTRWVAQLGPRLDTLRREARDRSLPHIGILYETGDLDEARAAYDQLVQGARILVMFGTGGSSLGGQTLAQLGGWFIPGDDRTGKSGRPRLRFYDNLDALSLVKGLEILDLANTRFVVISKSGNTAETLSQVLTVIDLLKRNGLEAAIPRMFLGITEPEKPGVANGLRDLFTRARRADAAAPPRHWRALFGVQQCRHDPGLRARPRFRSVPGRRPRRHRGARRGAGCSRFRAGARRGGCRPPSPGSAASMSA